MNWLYNKALYLWCFMEVTLFHAEQEYRGYRANINWIKSNNGR